MSDEIVLYPFTDRSVARARTRLTPSFVQGFAVYRGSLLLGTTTTAAAVPLLCICLCLYSTCKQLVPEYFPSGPHLSTTSFPPSWYQGCTGNNSSLQQQQHCSNVEGLASCVLVTKPMNEYSLYTDSKSVCTPCRNYGICWRTGFFARHYGYSKTTREDIPHALHT